MRKHNKQLAYDALYIVLSVLLTIVLVKTGFIQYIIGSLDGYTVLGIFVAGLFFTSVFTTAPAMAALGTFALNENIALVVLVGALGAAIGDYFIFRFVRDRVAGDIEYIIHATHEDKFFSIFKKRIFRWFVPFLGAIIIASPLPDELGITMLGLSKTKSRNFIFISYLFNAIGIIVICLVARAVK